MMKLRAISLLFTGVLLSGCGHTAKSGRSVSACGGEITHRSGIIINACGYSTAIAEALEFLGAEEPMLYMLASHSIRRIAWEGNPFWSLSRYPDAVSLSTYSFRRGKVFLASLIFHELSHIVAWKIRSGILSSGEMDEITTAYRAWNAGPGIKSIAHMPPYPQEEAIHRLQLAFLVKHHDTAGAELQRSILKDLPRTYRHLRAQ